MRSEQFRSWLMNTYLSDRTGAPLSKAAAADALSRCRRVEKRLRLDLDAELDGPADGETFVSRAEGHVERFVIDGDEASGMASIMRAVRLYVLFKDWERKVFKG